MRLLRSRLLRGVYERKLPGERVLAAELHTTRKTLGLALLQLETLGLVRRSERSGTFMVPLEERGRKPPGAFARLVLNVPISAAGHRDFWASPVIYGFQEAAHAHEVSLSLEYTTDVEQIVNTTIAQARLPRRVGVCLLGLPLETQHIVALAASGGPVVVAESHVEEAMVPCVTFDNIGAGQLAARHLVNLGHQRIALATYEELDSPSHRERLRGVESLLAQRGLELTTNKIIGSLESTEVLEEVMRRPTKVSAIVTGCARLAQDLLRFAMDCGRRVPQDLSVLALTGGTAQPRARVTGAAMDDIGLGRRAFEMLLDEELMANPRQVLIPVNLSDAGTTGPAPAD